MPLHVEIITREKKIFDEKDVDMVVIPGIEGEMGVLPNHAPILTPLNYGELTVRKGTAEEHFAIYGGIVDIRPDKVVILADTAQIPASVSQAALEDARARARTLAETAHDSQQSAAATQALRRAELALKVKNKVRVQHAIRIIHDDGIAENA